MRLPQFITAHTESIMQEWVNFARTRLPAAASMNELALRDDAATILREVVADMGGPQTQRQQKDKSQGLRPTEGGSSSTPHRHATQRALHGFETLQMVSEFRALRATVLRLWTQSTTSVDLQDMEDVTRFNEAIDESLAESLKIFVTQADHRRHLFMGVLGHDLRGPLHTIMSCAQLTLRKRPEDAREAGMILRSAAQIKALADDLLEFTMRGLNVDAPVVAADMRLDQFCRQTLDEIATLSPDRHLEFRCEGNPSGSWDGGRLHQLLWNLVVNALKYGASDRPVSVSVDGSREDEVSLTVHNFGKPIPPEIMPLLLAPLVRGSAEHVASSLPAGANMGLGLYIANTIAEAHGGKISVTSSAGEGTRFEVILPRRPRDATLDFA
jgi:signal transduction histidine kinase